MQILKCSFLSWKILYSFNFSFQERKRMENEKCDCSDLKGVEIKKTTDHFCLQLETSTPPVQDEGQNRNNDTSGWIETIFFTFLFKFTFRLELFDQDLKFRIYRSQDSRSRFRCFFEGLSNCLTNLWQKTIGCCLSELLKLFNNWYVVFYWFKYSSCFIP